MSNPMKISEILLQVFSFSEKGLWPAYALVCKQWMNVNLDLIWNKIEPESIVYIFKLLGPVRAQAPDYAYHFVAPPTEESWQRFRLYNYRIKEICMETLANDYVPLIASIHNIASAESFLPSLMRVRWLTTSMVHIINYGALFMPTGVTEFEVSIPPRDAAVSWTATESAALFRDMALRLPDLASLNFNIHYHEKTWIDILEPQFLALVKQLPKLQSIKALGSWRCLDKFATEWHELAQLRTISLYPVYPMEEYGWRGIRIGSMDAPSPNIPQLKRGVTRDYSLLEFLQLPLTFSALGFQLSTGPANNLTTLAVWSHQIETNDAVRALSTILANSCPQLKDLALASFTTRLVTGEGPTRVSFDRDLRPLLRCGSIVRFRWTHTYELQISDDVVEELATAWPKLQDLSFITILESLTGQYLPTSRALEILSRRAPALRALDLPIRSNGWYSPGAESAKFEHLQTIRLWGAEPQDVNPVAGCLVALAHGTCRVVAQNWSVNLERTMDRMREEQRLGQIPRHAYDDQLT